MGRPREHDEQTAERLLDAAERLLAAGGKEAVTVRAVADATGLSVRAVYSTHANKEGLIGALVGRSFERLADLVESVPETDDPQADLVAAGIRGFRQFAIDRPHLYRLNFEQTLLAPEGVTPPWARQGRRARLALRHWTTRLASAHPQIDPDATVIEFHAICQGLASTEINGVMRAMGARVDPSLHWDRVLRAYLEGVVAGGTN